MINLMKKVSQVAVGIASFLALAPKAFAEISVPFVAPPQGANLPSTADAVGRIPQFLITLLVVVGVIIAVVFLIYGGIKWILSGGDSKQVEGARNHIVAAIVGLIIVIGAFFILTVVFTIITGEAFNFGALCIPNLNDPTCGGAATGVGAL
jgi:hypothetical protein